MTKKDVVYKFFIEPTSNLSPLFDTLDNIFGDNTRIPFFIKKTVTTDRVTNLKTTRYSIFVEDSVGEDVKFEFPLKCKSASDRAIFDMFISVLKSKNVIS